MAELLGLFGFVVLLLIGLAAGRLAERSHFASLARREREVAARFVITDLRSFPGGALAGHGSLVAGHACISTDYFKSFVSSLRKIIGGELRAFETLMQRARREAVLRMLEQAEKLGYDAVCNVRLEGIDLGGAVWRQGKGGGVISASVMASGTAYKLADPSVRATMAPMQNPGAIGAGAAGAPSA